MHLNYQCFILNKNNYWETINVTGSVFFYQNKSLFFNHECAYKYWFYAQFPIHSNYCGFFPKVYDKSQHSGHMKLNEHFLILIFYLIAKI